MFLTIKRAVLFMSVYSALFFILSCKKESIKHKEKTKTIKEQPTTIIDENPETEFPKKGNKITDFVIPPYEIEYQTEGLLNDDKLEDAVIVLKNKNDKTDSRPTLVLLKQQNGGYKLQEVSWVAIGPEYTADDNKIYEDESISLDKKELNFSMYGIGPNGNKETIYRYVKNSLILVNINTYNRGAGGQSTMDYNPLTGDIIFVDVNTMIDSMPSTLTKKVYKLKNQIAFSKDDPDIVLDSIFKINY